MCGVALNGRPCDLDVTGLRPPLATRYILVHYVLPIA